VGHLAALPAISEHHLVLFNRLPKHLLDTRYLGSQVRLNLQELNKQLLKVHLDKVGLPTLQNYILQNVKHQMRDSKHRD
jgi:hypothetical protein